eukprot:7951-Heterococcus_DN1.PRE.1
MLNVEGIRMDQYLRIIEAHSARISSIELQHHCYLPLCTLPGTESPISVQSLKLKNVKWTGALPQMP